MPGIAATRGSDRAIRHCLELIRWAKLDVRCLGDFINTVLPPPEIPDPTEPGIVSSSTPTRPGRRVPLSPELREECIAIFTDYLTLTHSPAELVGVMERVPSQGVRQLREPLTALLAHPVHPVAAQAKHLLQTAGLVGDEQIIVPPPPPLKFRLLLDGVPLSGGTVAVSLLENPKPEDKEDSSSSYTWYGREFTTKENGEIEYSLEDCLEPERIRAVQFSPASLRGSLDVWGGLSDLPDLFLPYGKPENEWPGPWIELQVDAHAGDVAARDIELHAADLEVRVVTFAKFSPEIPIKILLAGAPANDRSPGERAAALTVRGAGGYFQQLQPGQYKLVVKAPGAARYESGEITIGNDPVVYEAKLEKGYDVRANVVYPGGAVRACLGLDGSSAMASKLRALAMAGKACRPANTRCAFLPHTRAQEILRNEPPAAQG